MNQSFFTHASYIQSCRNSGKGCGSGRVDGKFAWHEFVADGRTIVDLAHENDIAESNLYRWKSKSGGMEVSEDKRLRELG